MSLERRGVEAGFLDPDALRVIDAEVVEEIEGAVAYAEASPLPDPAELTHGVYVSE